ncbi:MAG: acylglycerol kinase family protein, partial [Selenomonadaceae bacterium]|nr:acylglycerol kinase family protein [Selenomonadaceae bacterium]
MRRLALAYNPVSGNATFKNRLDEMIEAFQRRGILLYLYRTKKDGNGELVDFLREARAEGVLAAGGDGTLHEVVNLVVKEGLDIPVGIIGSGTSNDFATYLNINENMEAYFDCIAEGRTR